MKSWSCIENCGACCKFDLSERSNLKDKLSNEDKKLIKSMSSRDGWCKHLDKKNKKCLIYEERPHFCRVDQFSTSFKEYLKDGGLSEVRVRCQGSTARIEIPQKEFEQFFKKYNFSDLVQYFSNLGFNCTSLDLEGLISGKLNR